MSSMNVVEQMLTTPSLIAVSDQTPPITSPLDAEVDLEVLKAVPKQFCVEDEESANWVLKRIIAARNYSQRVAEWAEAEKRRAAREEMTLMFLFGRQLERWAKEAISQTNGKRKSIVLPAATVGFRRSPAKVVIDDEKLVLAWAREHVPNAVVTVHKLAKIIFDAYLHETGHAPEEGIHTEPEMDKFYVR